MEGAKKYINYQITRLIEYEAKSDKLKDINRKTPYERDSYRETNIKYIKETEKLMKEVEKIKHESDGN